MKWLYNRIFRRHTYQWEAERGNYWGEPLNEDERRIVREQGLQALYRARGL